MLKCNIVHRQNGNQNPDTCVGMFDKMARVNPREKRKKEIHSEEILTDKVLRW